MTNKTIALLMVFFTLLGSAYSQISKRELTAKKTTATIKIDGELKEPVWHSAEVADKFVMYNPAPFIPESKDNATEVYILYSETGIYIGGFFHEKNKDSIAAELIGRDGFGNNDFIGVVFDTYNDKLNGFEYFLTPLGEQWDSKMTYGGNEDFGWNAVWEGASKIHSNGWSFEIFIPFSAIRYSKEKIQNWGLNIVRQRQKSGQKLFWQSIDPNINGFLSQEGTLKGLEDLNSPLRLQFSPYFSSYLTHDGTVSDPSERTKTSINGGMDVKYGLNEAYTLDMTLIPDFGQVQTDNMVLNLTPFPTQFSENRPFFTEGMELFGKGNLFYSRKIGGEPIHHEDAYNYTDSTETVIKNPDQSKLINATKISGRNQKGFGFGVLNAITKPQYAVIESPTKGKRKFETDPLTNYNVLVLDQTLKHNSSITFVNTNVTRSGHDYDANVSSFLFDLNDKTNTWNIGGSIGISALMNKDNKNIIGYTHGIYFGKTSGRLNFNFWQNLINDKYDKNDLGYLTNNNIMNQGTWLGYKWTKPRGWYNQMRLNFNLWHNRIVQPIDILKRKEFMKQSTGGNINMNAQTKKLWQLGASININSAQNDFYEPRVHGRFFHNKGDGNFNFWWNSNSAKKKYWGGNIYTGTGGVFNYKNYDVMLFGTIRFNSKFSVSQSVYVGNSNNQAGWASTKTSILGALNDTIIFSKRNVRTVENVLNIKYAFTNKMVLTLQARHNWGKVDPKEFYELNTAGRLQSPSEPFTENVNLNYNFLSVDMLFNWQIAQGSFVSFAWKDVAKSSAQMFERNYFTNLGKTIKEPQFNSLSVRVIYFLDYITLKNNRKKNRSSAN